MWMLPLATAIQRSAPKINACVLCVRVLGPVQTPLHSCAEPNWVWFNFGATLARHLIQTAHRVSNLIFISCREKEKGLGPISYLRIWFGTWEERRMNHLPLQCRIMRQTLSNLTFLPHQIKTAVPNWFRRRSFAVLNTSVRFGTWVERRLNRAVFKMRRSFIRSFSRLS